MWSLTRTILAVLNVLGAIVFLVFAAKDYGVRQSWAFANLVSEVAVDGLPLDENETNAEGEKVAAALGTAGKSELFGGAAGPTTQLEEVKRFKDKFDGAIAANPDKMAQLVALARILTPLATSNTQRENYSSIRTYLANANTAKQLKSDLVTAATTSKAEQGKPAKAFEANFADNVLTLAGPPRAPFAEAFLAERKKSPTKKPEELFDDSIDSLRQNLQTTYDNAFAPALAGRMGDKEVATKERKAFIASLLFNLTEPLSEIELGQAVPPGQQWDVTQGSYGRFLRVVGLAAGVKAIRQEAIVQSRIADEMKLDISRDRTLFVTTHQDLVIQLQQAAAKETALGEALARVKDLLAQQQALVNRRKGDVAKFEADLAELRKETADRLAVVKAMADELYKVRIATRNATEANQKSEGQIRTLEEGK
jgi:hypothetical protein